MPDPTPRTTPAPQCPICGKPSAPKGPARLAPFCSRRCADVDLGRWFTGAYSVPAVEADEDSPHPDSDT